MEAPLEKLPLTPGHRRHFTVALKRSLLVAAASPGSSISAAARQYGNAPNMVIPWRRATDDAGDEGLKLNDKVKPESEVKKLKARIAGLERALGRKTVDNEILNHAVEVAVEKKRYRPHSRQDCEVGGEPNRKCSWCFQTSSGYNPAESGQNSGALYEGR